MTMKRCQYFMAGHICWKMKQNGSFVKTVAHPCFRIYLLNSLQLAKMGVGAHICEPASIVLLNCDTRRLWNWGDSL